MGQEYSEIVRQAARTAANLEGKKDYMLWVLVALVNVVSLCVLIEAFRYF
jgi:hypothetical protein